MSVTLDRLMRRTRSRPFASGTFSESPWWLAGFLGLLAASLALACGMRRHVAAAYVFLGAFTYGIVYTVWLKRRSIWNIVVGGLAGSFAVLAGAAAVDPSPQVVPTVLAIVLFLWTPPHFWSLAAAKGEDYAKAGVPMLPVVVPAYAWTIGDPHPSVALVGRLAGAALVRRRAGLWARCRDRRRLFRLEERRCSSRRRPRRMRWRTSSLRWCSSALLIAGVAARRRCQVWS